MRTRLSVRAYAGDNKPVFNAHPLKTKPPMLSDVQDAFIAVKGMRESDARSYMLSIGIDYDNACKYYASVDFIDRCYRKSKSDDWMNGFKINPKWRIN